MQSFAETGMELKPNLSVVVGPLVMLLLALGCTRAPDPEFTANAGIAELPERHQAIIAKNMRRLFGTPSDPRQRMPDPDAEEPEEDPEAEESEDDSEAEESEEGQSEPKLIDVVDPGHLKHGATVYNARCAGCHGITGDGAGTVAEHLLPKPRDYRQGTFKFTSTPYGSKPARHDLVRVIRRGAKGTSMPAFPWMSDTDLNAVIDYVIFLSKRGEVEKDVLLMAGEYLEDEDIEFVEFSDAIEAANESWAAAEDEVVLPVTAEPHYTEETVVAGRQLFLSQGCSKCHGVDGKGQTEWLSSEFIAKQESLPEDQRIKINYDRWGNVAPAADLTARLLHGGRRPIDIYRRIHTGINGTPMPTFAGLFAEEPEKIWQLVHYVRHVIEGGDPTAGIESLPEEATDPAGEADAPAEETADASAETAA